jgi:hypothetical protein
MYNQTLMLAGVVEYGIRGGYFNDLPTEEWELMGY